MITKYQENILLGLSAILALDAIITIYAATYYGIYEANPLLLVFGTSLSTFTNVVLISKIIAASAVILATAYCNKIGEAWGNALCVGSLSVMVLWFAAIGIINIVVIYRQ